MWIACGQILAVVLSSASDAEPSQPEVAADFTGTRLRRPAAVWVFFSDKPDGAYLAERLDRGYEAFKECRVHIDRPPSEYLKNFYYDTVNFDIKALEFAVDFAGVDHLASIFLQARHTWPVWSPGSRQSSFANN